MGLARWLVQNVQSGSEETDKDSSSTPDNEKMQLLIMEGENYKEIQLTNPTSQPAILKPHNPPNKYFHSHYEPLVNSREYLTLHGIKHSHGWIIKKVAIVYCVFTA